MRERIKTDTAIRSKSLTISNMGSGSLAIIPAVVYWWGWRHADDECVIMNVNISKPETPTQIDPVTLEVIRNKLDGISTEMQWTLLHSSSPPIIKEGMAASARLFAA